MKAGVKILRPDDIMARPEVEGGPKELDLTEIICSNTSKLEVIRKEATEKSGTLLGESDDMATRKQKATESGSDENKEEVVKEMLWLMKTLTVIIGTQSPPMRIHKYKFENILSASKQNARWLRHYRWDLEEAVQKHAGTRIYPGLGFREVKVIKEIWRRHEL